MTISERIFMILEEKHISQRELSRRTGIPVTTISDWNVKKTNPAAEKIMPICKALDITPEELLTGTSPAVMTEDGTKTEVSYTELRIVDDYRELSEEQKKRFLAYMKRMKRNRKD